MNGFYSTVITHSPQSFGSNHTHTHIPVDWNELKLSFDTLHSLALRWSATVRRQPLQPWCYTYFAFTGYGQLFTNQGKKYSQFSLPLMGLVISANMLLNTWFHHKGIQIMGVIHIST